MDSKPQRSLRSQIIGTLAGLLVINIVTAAAAVRLPDPLTWSSYHMQRQADRVEATDGCLDVVLSGSSVMGAAADPAFLDGAGHRVINASIGGVGPRVIDDWVTRILVPRTCPEVVVLGFSPRDANDNFVELDNIYDRYVATEGRRRFIGETGSLDSVDNFLESHVGLFQVRSAFRQPAQASAFLLNGSGNWRVNTAANGQITTFQDRQFEWSPTVEREILDDSFFRYSHGEIRMKAMESALVAAGESGATVVLVNLPRPTEATVRLMPDGESQLDDFDNAMRDMAERAGAGYLDATELDLSDEFFADTFHLNGTGSAVLSSWLNDQLNEIAI